jgi:hypothetical protein
VTGLGPIGVLWIVGDRGSAEGATLRWLRLLPGEQFHKHVLVLTSEVSLEPSESPSDAELWMLPDFIASDQVAQFIVEFIASRTIEIVDIIGSRTGSDLVPSIKEAFPGMKVVAGDLSALEPGVDLLQYIASHYGNVFDRFIVETEGQGRELQRNHISPSKMEFVDTDGEDRDQILASLHEKIFVELFETAR